MKTPCADGACITRSSAPRRSDDGKFYVFVCRECECEVHFDRATGEIVDGGPLASHGEQSIASSVVKS